MQTLRLPRYSLIKVLPLGRGKGYYTAVEKLMSIPNARFLDFRASLSLLGC